MDIFELSQRGGLYAALSSLGHIIEETTVKDQLMIRITSPSGRVWMSGSKMAYPMNNHYVHQIADNKQLSYELANRLGIHIPHTMYVNRGTDIDQIRLFMSQYSEVIIKPLDSYKSRGVTLEVDTNEALTDALEDAYKFSPTAIIQEQVRGEEYRFTILEGEIVSVLRRERPQVQGDGTSTISQLVERENTLRRSSGARGADYPQWTDELMGASVRSDHVLNKDEVRLLSTTTMVSQGASAYELADEVDDSYMQVATTFAATLGAGLSAIDMFIVDHTAPAAQGGYWFNECNTSPSLKMYSLARNADASWVADKIVNATHRHLNISV